ncbi:M14 metallopeptidase family protein [Pseudoalteromonas ruthenica]|uniref:M14 metallopeptidase family protein n=1 Tax=Pseudoalteromonas ruthenica TaxID=151081 RepID=UPI0012470DBD|nr:M14 metallopeptidase family protein [Pseudoalteromonas ruthenica]
MRRILFLVVLLFASSLSAKPLDYYFNNDIQFDPNVPTPQSVLGYEVGEWHVRHDQLVYYMRALADASERVNIETIGYTHERRPLLMLTFAAPQRLADIEQVRAQHLARLEGEPGTNDDPAVVYMGYSVHGNESSGSNAALLVAYYLAAAQDQRVEKLLNDTVVLLDPSLNPDGLARFANWANSNRAMTPSADPQTREHDENWPSSRTNHYWFDLNRDWLLLQHPESRARIAQFHKWQPNVLTDFHEMGPSSTYFFQPGIPSRKNPLTPNGNVDLTKAIAKHHARILDSEERLYFTEEAFDDFYVGKGSTYPDVNGSIGILFEQASSRGHVQDTVNGQMDFAFTIKNQLLTSFSTFDAVLENRQQLLDYQQDFYQQVGKLADKDKLKGYVVSAPKDATRLDYFLELLAQHQIKAYALEEQTTVDKRTFAAPNSYFVPLAQRQYRLIKSIFSEQQSFNDNTFYDVSAWTLAHAFNLEFAPLSSTWGLELAEQPWQQGAQPSAQELTRHYAYAFEWFDYDAPKLLSYLLREGVNARVALAPLSAKSGNATKQFAAGSIVIPAGIQQHEHWLEILNEAQQRFAIPIVALDSGLTSKGVDLGSRQLAPVHLPKVLLVGGKQTSQYEVGELWYYLDRHVGITPSIIELDNLSGVSLDNYTHIVLANGRYSAMSKAQKVALQKWVKRGGVIWGQKGGAKFLVDQQILKASYVSRKDMAAVFATEGLKYGDQDMLAGKQRIAGAIFNTEVDLTHPLSYSLTRKQLPVFKNSTFLLEQSSAPFVNVAKYTEKPLLAGFTHDNNVTQVANAGAIVAHSYGQGTVVAMTDNPVFRGFWYGTSRIFSNALFFGEHIHARGE